MISIKCSGDILYELLEGQRTIEGNIGLIEDEVKQMIRVSVKEISSLAGLGVKSMYTINEKYQMNTTSEVCRIVKGIAVLPVKKYKILIGRVMGIVFEHICQKILEVHSFSPADIEAVCKFMKPFLDYEKILFNTIPQKDTKFCEVFFLHVHFI